MCNSTEVIMCYTTNIIHLQPVRCGGERNGTQRYVHDACKYVSLLKRKAAGIFGLEYTQLILPSCHEEKMRLVIFLAEYEKPKP